jgi:hypothetical protein
MPRKKKISVLMKEITALLNEHGKALYPGILSLRVGIQADLFGEFRADVHGYTYGSSSTSTLKEAAGTSWRDSPIAALYNLRDHLETEVENLPVIPTVIEQDGRKYQLIG